MPAKASTAVGAETVELSTLLADISRESVDLAQQCGTIQGSLSAILEIVDHPDLGAEIHMLQDIDRIQQTLADIASILVVAGGQATRAPIPKDEIGSAIRLESLRRRLGLCENLPGEAPVSGASDITWF